MVVGWHRQKVLVVKSQAVAAAAAAEHTHSNSTKCTHDTQYIHIHIFITRKAIVTAIAVRPTRVVLAPPPPPSPPAGHNAPDGFLDIRSLEIDG